MASVGARRVSFDDRLLSRSVIVAVAAVLILVVIAGVLVGSASGGIGDSKTREQEKAALRSAASMRNRHYFGCGTMRR
jgi:hypothetical protein